MFTQVRSTNRRVSPGEVNGRAVMKAVYVVLEPQYQHALTQAANSLNDQNGPLAIELSGYLIEELRDPQNYADFQADVAAADVFIASLIFIEDLAQKVVEAVAPHRDRLKAAVVFPSMPEVMRLNKLGTFSMAQLGQSKSAIASFMKKRKEAGGAGFQDAMLKLLNTLPTVLKYLPVEKAQDARSFMLSFQYWLGGTPDNLRNFLLMLADKYVFPRADSDRAAVVVAEPEVFPDLGIWHPLAPGMFTDLKEYLNWTSSRTDLSEKALQGPLIGLVLQRSHIVTGDEAHYVAIIQELEYRGARVIPVFCGGLDFTKPVNAFFYDPLNPDVPLVDGVVSLTGFALVGGPARQDHPKAIEVLQKLNRPYMVALPLVFQTTQEWEESDLGLHPVQVALQIAIPELATTPPARPTPSKTGWRPSPNARSAGPRCG
jgi:magnesium chelatase subunit H